VEINEEPGNDKRSVHKDTRKATALIFCITTEPEVRVSCYKMSQGMKPVSTIYKAESKLQLKDWKHITTTNRKKFKECVTSRKNHCYGLLG
jgi:hypothetical protein